MNILFLHSSADSYGSGKILLSVASALLKAGHNEFAVLPVDGPMASAFRDKGVDVEIFELGILRREYYNFPGMVNRFVSMFGAICKLRRQIRRKNIDLVYTNTAAVWVGGFASRLSGVVHVWHIQEIIVSPRMVARAIAWAVKHLADQAIAVSTAVKENLDSLSPGRDERVRVVFSAINSEAFGGTETGTLRTIIGAKEGEIIVGMIGRVHFWKGQEYFLEIAHEIRRNHPAVRFVMIGDAYPGYEYLYERIASARKRLGLEDSVHDLGFRNDIPDLLRDFDIFLLPSILPDPFPTVVLEAMWSGKPVVATAHGGALEMVEDAITGYLIPWDDPVRSCEIITPLLTSRETRIAMGRAGRERTQRLFSYDVFSRQIADVVESLRPRPKGPSLEEKV